MGSCGDRILKEKFVLNLLPALSASLKYTCDGCGFLNTLSISAALPFMIFCLLNPPLDFLVL